MYDFGIAEIEFEEQALPVWQGGKPVGHFDGSFAFAPDTSIIAISFTKRTWDHGVVTESRVDVDPSAPFFTMAALYLRNRYIQDIEDAIADWRDGGREYDANAQDEAA